MPENDIINNQRIEDMPGFRDAVNNLIIEMLRSGQATDALLDAMNGEAQVGMQAQPPPPLHREQFDKTDTRLPQMIRYTKGSAAGDAKYEIMLPGSYTNVPNSPPGAPSFAFVSQNGNAINIDPEDVSVVGNGPWWHLVNCDGSTGTPTTTIFAMVRPGTGSPAVWPVAPDTGYVAPDTGCLVKFYTQDNKPSDPAAGLAIRYGLFWTVAKIVAQPDGAMNIISQMTIGSIIQTASIGDADVNAPTSAQDARVSSIVQVSPGVFQALNVGMVTPVASSNSNPVWCRVGNQTTGVMTLMDPSGLGGGDTTPTDPSTSVTTLGPHDSGDSALSDTATCNGTLGIKLWVTTGVVYTPAGDHVLYFFRRLMTFTAKGKLYSVGPETSVNVNSPDPI